MLSKVAIASFLAATTLTIGVARATDIPATPVNAGPPVNLPGVDVLPGLREALLLVNGVTQPILQPILAPGPGPAVAPSPLLHHHHWLARRHAHEHRRFARAHGAKRQA